MRFYVGLDSPKQEGLQDRVQRGDGLRFSLLRDELPMAFLVMHVGEVEHALELLKIGEGIWKQVVQ